MKLAAITILLTVSLTGCATIPNEESKIDPTDEVDVRVLATVSTKNKEKQIIGKITKIEVQDPRFIVHFEPENTEEAKLIEILPFREDDIPKYIGKRASYTDISLAIKMATEMLERESNKPVTFISFQRIDSFKLIDD